MDIIFLKISSLIIFLLFFLKNPPPPETSPFPLHDALPISAAGGHAEPNQPHGLVGRASSRTGHAGDAHADIGTQPHPGPVGERLGDLARDRTVACDQDRKSTRLNSSHLVISYAVFCLKKKI